NRDAEGDGRRRVARAGEVGRLREQVEQRHAEHRSGAETEDQMEAVLPEQRKRPAEHRRAERRSTENERHAYTAKTRMVLNLITASIGDVPRELQDPLNLGALLERHGVPPTARRLEVLAELSLERVDATAQALWS